MTIYLRHYFFASPSFVWPDATNTGVPAGTVLTEYSALSGGGPDTITEANWSTYSPNRTIQNKIVRKQLTIEASGLIFRNCRFIVDDRWCIQDEAQFPLQVYDCEFQGRGLLGNMVAPILGCGTFERIHSYGANMAINCTGGSTTCRSSYFHDMGYGDTPDPHYDGFFIGGGQTSCLFEDNWIDMPRVSGTAHFFINTQFGTSTGPIMVRHNKCTGSPSYPMYSTAVNPGEISGAVSFVNNHIERGDFGYWLIDNVPQTARSGNVDVFTGANIDTA